MTLKYKQYKYEALIIKTTAPDWNSPFTHNIDISLSTDKKLLKRIIYSHLQWYAMVYGEMISWREYQDLIIFEIFYKDTYIELISYKDGVFNLEHINGGKYILFDSLKKEIFII